MEFQKIKNYSNYAISTEGEIVRYLKNGTTKPVTLRKKVYGGFTVNLSNRAGKDFDLATLMANAFIGDCPKGKVVRYIDDNHYNCSAANLYYGDHKDYFMTDTVVHQGVKGVRISKNRWVMEDGSILSRTVDGLATSIPTRKKGYVYLRYGATGSNLHRLVAQFFLPNPNNLPVVDHIDEDKNNNNASNLRWCTYKENAEYYISDNGKDYRKSLQDKMEKRLNKERGVVIGLQNDVKVLKAELVAAKKAVTKEHEAFYKYKQQELLGIERSKTSYNGSPDIKGVKFGSIENLVKATGKNITIDGTEFISAGSAATYIKDAEKTLGNSRNQATISKELRRFLQGKRPQWVMYEKYTIGY